MNKKLSRMFMTNLTLYFVVMALFCVITLILHAPVIAIVEAVIFLVLAFYYKASTSRRKREIGQYLQDANISVDSVSGEEMTIPVPAAILNMTDSEIMWCNDAFMQLADASDNLFDISLSTLLPYFDTQWLLDGRTQYPDSVILGDRRFFVYGDLIHSSFHDSGYTAAMLYFVDATELLDLRDEYELSRPVVGLILVDNYDELTSNLPDRAVSGLSAQLDDAISKWSSVTNGILRKLERNRYLFIFESRQLPKFIDSKFGILDTVRSITNETGSPATLSIGIGKDGETFRENYDFASLGLEMCLSRGGDQAVVKDRYNFSFYGGRAKEAERRTKVKSRVMAGSLQELISQSSEVFIMGHKNADLDAIGAATGIMAICRKLECPAYIVVDLEFNASHSLLNLLLDTPAYKKAFLTPSEATAHANEYSLLVVVDTNRPDQVESGALLDICQRVAVIDHHRRAADYIGNALLNFHEPYASSACELVTELVQNLLEKEDLLPVELISLLSGIVLDTKNFSVRTGSRTFEAAAWLRKNGADTVAVKLLFQNDLKATISRYEIIQRAEIYRDNIALCCLDYTSDRITAAQAADELLNISGIEASFVFYPDGDRVICSARSIGEANVQMILEPLGGGGNQATAGAQIPGMTPNQVKAVIQSSIDEFFS